MEISPQTMQARIQRARRDAEALKARIERKRYELFLADPVRLNSEDVMESVKGCYSDSAMSFFSSLILMLPDYWKETGLVMTMFFSNNGPQILRRSRIKTKLTFGPKRNVCHGQCRAQGFPLSPNTSTSTLSQKLVRPPWSEPTPSPPRKNSASVSFIRLQTPYYPCQNPDCLRMQRNLILGSLKPFGIFRRPIYHD